MPRIFTARRKEGKIKGYFVEEPGEVINGKWVEGGKGHFKVIQGVEDEEYWIKNSIFKKSYTVDEQDD